MERPIISFQEIQYRNQLFQPLLAKGVKSECIDSYDDYANRIQVELQIPDIITQIIDSGDISTMVVLIKEELDTKPINVYTRKNLNTILNHVLRRFAA